MPVLGAGKSIYSVSTSISISVSVGVGVCARCPGVRFDL